MNTYSKTEIGQLPEDWGVLTLEEACEPPQYGYTDSSSKTGNVKFLRITDIEEWGVDWRAVPFCNCSDSSINKYLLRNKDIVVARIGATTGKSYIINNPPRSVFASYLIRIRVKPHLNPDFLFYYLKSEKYWQQINANKNSNLKKGVSGSVLKQIITPYPKKDEQDTIVEILYKIQLAIEAKGKIIETTTELKKALVEKLFVEGLNNETKKETEIGLMPQNWDICDIEAVLLETKTRNPGNIPNGFIKYVDVSSVSNTTFSVVSHQSFLGKDAPGRARKVIYTNDVIFATIRPTLKRIAKINLEYNDEYCSTAFCVLRADPDKLDFEFLYQYLLTEGFIQRIAKLQSGASYPAVRDDDVKSSKMPLPPLDEQREIGRILNTLDAKMDVSIRQKQTFQSLFNSMLQHLMTGQIRVKDLSI